MSSKSTARNPPPLPGAVKGVEEEEEEAALSISDRRTLYLVNIFIGNTARFLNSFSSVCEEKLADVHRRILRVDATLTLLESQLRSTDRSPKETKGFSGSEAAGPSHSDRSTDESGEPSSRIAIDVQQKLTISQPET